MLTVRVEKAVRSLSIFAATPHHHICRARLGLLVFLVRLLASGGLLEEAHGRACHAAHVATSIRTNDTKQALTCLLGQVGLFEDPLGAVDVGEIESGAGVAGVEDGCQTDPRLKGLDHDAVHFVVDDVSD